ncbi:MAG: GNAT family N-acetyltransferase [Candidatus Poribacteria bacterium]|nr:GNAT family N-acetyltransferase [Candidatus Poribacteria bacterium]
MANQDFNLIGAIKVRSAEENDAPHLHAYCFPEKTGEQVAEELRTDLETGNGTYRLVAEASGYPIGQVTVKHSPINPEIAQVGNLAVAGPFRQLGVADHLMGAAEATATANGVKSLEVELAPSEASVIQRYKDWGFIEKPVVVLQKVLEAEVEEAAAEAEIEVEVDDTDRSTEDEASENGDGQTSLLDA